MHGGPVDHQGAAAQLLRQLDRLPHRSLTFETTQRGPHGIHAQVRPRRERRTPGDLREGTCRAQRVGGCVQHHRRDVQQHAVEDGGEVRGVDTGLAHLYQERGGAVLEVGQPGGVGGLGVRFRQEYAHVPAVAAGRRSDRVRKVGHEAGGAERRDRETVQGRVGEPFPHGVVGIVLAEPPRLAEDGRGSAFPLRHVVFLPVGQRQVGIRGHVRRIRTVVRRGQSL